MKTVPLRETQNSRSGPATGTPWHVLDANSIWIKEFSAALHRITPVTAWIPEMSWTGMFRHALTSGELVDPRVPTCRFYLQHGYSRPPLSTLVNLGPDLIGRIRPYTETTLVPLICTTPYYAPVAELWPGPVVYYLTDLTKAYKGANPKRVTRLDTRMCRAATLVCPNSRRIAHYLCSDAGCPISKVVIVPNATRSENVFDSPPESPSSLPDDAAHLPRPVVGVIGNLAGNLDWLLVKEAVRQNPTFSWVFVGPTIETISDIRHRRAREDLLEHRKNVVFTGPKPYSHLRDYARSFDVAFLPYCARTEPTYSGSSTRFYEHLAACRPMIATRGFEELLHQEPLLTLADGPNDVTMILSGLRDHYCRDGYEQLRWRASLTNTWDQRALAVYNALLDRVA